MEPIANALTVRIQIKMGNANGSAIYACNQYENIVEISQTVKLNDFNNTDNESDIEISDVDIDAQYESEYEENENGNFDGCDDFEVSDKTYTEE